ncbi:MAG: carotenoid oxygenase family protein [Myxococcota bacterium]
MAVQVVRTFDSGLGPTEHPYLTGPWTPTHREVDADDMEIIGEIPKDLSGVYLRNTENPVFEAKGTYHPFDGDGMLHAISFRHGRARYRNRFVQTKGFVAEQEAGRSLWAGLVARPSAAEREGWGARGGMKDASSTDVVVHAGRVLSTFYMCGEGYELSQHLETLGTAAWVPQPGVSAHPKVDLRTGELLFFNYGKAAPYMHYGVVNAAGKRTHYIPIETPGPRLPHDMAFTENFAILADMPLFWDPELLPAGVHASRYYPELPTRFAVVPRHGSASEVRWFEAAPTYVLHWMNAYEDGAEIVLDGYFQEAPDPDPIALPGLDPRYGKMLAFLDEASFKPKLHRWRFNLRTGETREERLDDRVLEFGTFNQDYAGRKARYAYSTFTKPGWFLFKGFVKHDLETGDSQRFELGEGRYGSEAPFAPRDGAESEDDGYLVSFVTDMNEGRSECAVFDAKNLRAGPVCRVILPHVISSGTHATWARHDEFTR